MIHLAVSEPITWGSIVGLLSGLLTILTAIFRYVRKAWGAVDTLLQTVDATAGELKQVVDQVQETERRLKSVEAIVAEIQTSGSDSLNELKTKLEAGQISTKSA